MTAAERLAFAQGALSAWLLHSDLVVAVEWAVAMLRLLRQTVLQPRKPVLARLTPSRPL